MHSGLFSTARSLLLSVALHVVIGLLLVFSFEFTPAPPPIKPKINVVNAVSVDKQAVEQELQRLADQEQAKKEAEQKKQRELERKAEEARKKREAEERKLAEIKKKKEQELKKQKQAEQKRKQLEQEKKELEKQRQLELEKKKKAEAERKRVEAEKKKLEEEKKRQEEEARKQEEERKRKAEEERKKEQERKRKEEEERKRREAERAMQEELQAEQDMDEIQKYFARIGRAIEGKFNKLGLPEGLSCVISIRLIEGGKVADVAITEPSGNALFDERAQRAVYLASPLPVPSEPRIFNKMRTFQILFRPKN